VIGQVGQRRRGIQNIGRARENLEYPVRTARIRVTADQAFAACVQRQAHGAGPPGVQFSETVICAIAAP
jgi:hypothetical protein